MDKRIDERFRKPRRSKGTPFFVQRNYWAAGVIAFGGLSWLLMDKTKTTSLKATRKPLASNVESVTNYFKQASKILLQGKMDETESQVNSISPPQSLKKIDTKTIFNDSADDDFRSPMVLRKKTNPAWKLNKGPKQQKRKSKSNKKGKTTRNSTLEIIKENFVCAGENPEHLQMAIALSKSSYEAKHGVSSDAATKEETPNISEILQNSKVTNLERFGFKAGKSSILPVEKRRPHVASTEPSKRVRNRFKYITPILTIRSKEERDSLIASKISVILSQSNSTHTKWSEPLVASSRLKDFAPKNHSIFQTDELYKNHYFYVENLNLPKTSCRCGYLLKDWSSIIGRDKSPERPTKIPELVIAHSNYDVVNDDNTENSTTDPNQQSPAKKTGEKRISKGTPLITVQKNHEGFVKSWVSDSKDSGIPSSDQLTVGSISSSFRSISPDLFGSDDEYCYEAVNETDNVKHLDANSLDVAKIDNSTESFLSFFENPPPTSTRVDPNDSDKNPHFPTIDLTEKDIELVNKSLSSYSFKRLASFYSLDEFEEDESGKAQLNPNVREINVNDKKVKSIHHISNEDIGEGICLLSQKNSDSRQRMENKNTAGLNESLEDNNIHTSNSLLPTKSAEFLDGLLPDYHFDNDKKIYDLCITKDPFDTSKINYPDFGDNLSEYGNKDIISSTSPIKDISYKSELFRSSEVSNSSIPNLEVIKTSLPKKDRSLDCIEIIDDSIPDYCFEDADTFSRVSTSSSILCHNFEENENDALSTPVLNGFDACDHPFTDMDPFSPAVGTSTSPNPIENKTKDLTSPTKPYPVQIMGNLPLKDIIESDHLTEKCSINKTPKISSEWERVSPVEQLFSLKPNITPQCIEILDDSMGDHNFEDLNTHSEKFEENECRAYTNLKDTPKKGSTFASCSLVHIQDHDLDERQVITPVGTTRISSSRNSHIYNSADLNVTDYVNNLLNKETFSFDNGSELCDDESDAMSLSQDSQTSVVDEELNYSSHFSTPSRIQTLDARSRKVFDLVTVEELNDDLDDNPVTKNISSKAPLPPKLSAVAETSTNKKSISTPDKYLIKTKNVTPMPDYGQMATPIINKELQKVGVKPLKRARATKLLKYIYESTHPLAGSVQVLEQSDSDEDGKIIKRRKRSPEIISNIDSSVKLTDSTDASDGHQSVSLIEIVGDQIIQNEKPDDLIFERRQSVRISSCQVPLQIIWHNFLSCNPTIKENILLYEPLQLESLHLMLKELGFKFHMQDLLTFLDKKCITIRTAQKQGKRHR